MYFCRRSRIINLGRFYQLLSGHAITPPFLKESGSGSSLTSVGGATGEGHLFKECKGWKSEIYRLWEEVGNVSGQNGHTLKSRRGFGQHGR